MNSTGPATPGLRRQLVSFRPWVECKACNGHKGSRMPEEANMTLLYLPYVPSLHEDMILRGRRILADQMDFLLASVPRSSRLHG